jgi:hypothetical protein
VDVLIAFAAFAKGGCGGGGTCRPTLLPPASQSAGGGGGAVLDLARLWNPCAVPSQGGCIVPNDLALGAAR